MNRPCINRHPEPVAGCTLCWLAQNSAIHKGLWGGEKLVARQGETGWKYKVKKMGCRKKCRWAWSVTLDGVQKDSGAESTEREAHAAATESMEELKALVG